MLNYMLYARDATILSGDNRVSGLSPVWVFYKKADGTAVTPSPVIQDIGLGRYLFAYPELNYDVFGQVDMGASLTNGSDRYIDIFLNKETGILLNNLDAVLSTRYGIGNDPPGTGTEPDPVLSPGMRQWWIQQGQIIFRDSDGIEFAPDAYDWLTVVIQLAGPGRTVYCGSFSGTYYRGV